METVPVPAILAAAVVLVAFAIWPLVLVYNLLVHGPETLDGNTIIAAVIIVPIWTVAFGWLVRQVRAVADSD